MYFKFYFVDEVDLYTPVRGGSVLGVGGLARASQDNRDSIPRPHDLAPTWEDLGHICL